MTITRQDESVLRFKFQNVQMPLILDAQCTFLRVLSKPLREAATRRLQAVPDLPQLTGVAAV